MKNVAIYLYSATIFSTSCPGGGIGRPACRQAGALASPMYYVYILQSLRTKRFYKGISNDLERRVEEHLNGESPSTKHMLPLQLIHVEVCADRMEARKLEKFFKSGYGREIIHEITASM